MYTYCPSTFIVVRWIHGTAFTICTLAQHITERQRRRPAQGTATADEVHRFVWMAQWLAARCFSNSIAHDYGLVWSSAKFLETVKHVYKKYACHHLCSCLNSCLCRMFLRIGALHQDTSNAALVHMCSFCRHWTWSLTARASLWLQRSHNDDHMRHIRMPVIAGPYERNVMECQIILQYTTSYIIILHLKCLNAGGKMLCIICCVGFGYFSWITLSVVFQAHLVPF